MEVFIKPTPSATWNQIYTQDRLNQNEKITYETEIELRILLVHNEPLTFRQLINVNFSVSIQVNL